MTQVAEQTTGTVADAPPTCSTEGCTKPAVFAYAWEWGEKGVCCDEHRFLLTQTSEHLKRSVHFAPLQAAARASLTRDERTQLIAAKLSAESEIEDLKTRGLDLYRENTQLTSQLQSLTVRARETAAQLKDATAHIADLDAQLRKRDAEHGELTDEVSRLRTMAKFVDAPPPEATGKKAKQDRGLNG